MHWIQIAALPLLLLLCIPLLGTYMARLFQGEIHFLRPLEQFCYRVSGVSQEEMSAGTYLKALLLFNALGFCFLLLILLLQGLLPLNPLERSCVPFPLAFNIASSFVTNTNWQSYAGETTLSFFSQMVGLTVQNFLSAATGITCLVALIRGLAQSSASTVGNFWVDLIRSLLYLLLPLALCFSLFLIFQGSPQTLRAPIETTTLEGRPQVIPIGPIASQVAIKLLGTNGGGFFNVNSAHPFENPTPLTSFVSLLAILLIPASLVYTYGVMTRSKKQGWILLLLMGLLWGGGVALSLTSENTPNPLFNALPHLEGKEMRIGMTGSILWSVSTTATSNGAINCSLDSLSPLAGGVCLFNMLLGELIFGGVGVGLATLLMFVLLTLFLSGLMVGRTPEYEGKKIEKREVQWVCLALLFPSALILIGSSIALPFDSTHAGPHGLTALLYTFASPAANNGSAFASVDATSFWYQIGLGMIMLLGRLSILVPSLLIAGRMGAKPKVALSQGTLTSHTSLFFCLTLGIILILGALTFFPALSLGPILEQLLMQRGEAF
jgi:K+-transporting ATPase ATPase A chain